MARPHTRSGLGGAFAVRLASSSDADILYDACTKDPEGEREGNPGNVCATSKGEVFIKTRGKGTKSGWERLVTEDEIKDLVVSDYAEEIASLVAAKVTAATAELVTQIEEMKARLDTYSGTGVETEEAIPEDEQLKSLTPDGDVNPPETAAQRKAREKAEKAAQGSES